MKNQKDKNIREPFSPEHTPNPPQIIDPSRGSEQGDNQKPLKTEPKNQQQESNVNKEKGSGKKLGDETEITDETTI